MEEVAIPCKLIRETVKTGKGGKIKIHSVFHAIFKLFFPVVLKPCISCICKFVLKTAGQCIVLKSV